MFLRNTPENYARGPGAYATPARWPCLNSRPCLNLLFPYLAAFKYLRYTSNRTTPFGSIPAGKGLVNVSVSLPFTPCILEAAIVTSPAVGLRFPIRSRRR